MKLIAVLGCVAFLYCLSSGTAGVAIDHATEDFTNADDDAAEQDEMTASDRAEDLRDDTEDSLAVSDGDHPLEYSRHSVSLQSEISSCSRLSCYCCPSRRECQCCFYLPFNDKQYYGKYSLAILYKPS